MPVTDPPTKAAAATTLMPRAFGAYELLAPLAEGGMGAVWLARRRGGADVQGFCAVKTVLRSLSAQPSFLARFKDEARVVVTLNHRALCHVFDVGVVDGESYMAMELVEGATLSRFLVALQEEASASSKDVTSSALPLEVALAIADELGDALAHIHERCDPVTGAPLHIVHRDISPQNILVTFQGGVKVVDFGVVSSSLRRERTEAGLVIGKLHYMAPEQARGEPATPATDVYSAAVVLYELVTGRRFWGALDKGVVMMELVDGQYLPPLDDDSGVPAALRAVLGAALDPDPARRLQDGAALQAALAAVTSLRAGPRALRDLVGRVLRPEQERLAALMRGAASTTVTPADEATSITHLATAPIAPSGEPTRADRTPPAVAAAAARPHRSGPSSSSTPRRGAVDRLPRAAVAIGTALGTAVLVVGAWLALQGPTVSPPSVVASSASASTTTLSPTPPPTRSPSPPAPPPAPMVAPAPAPSPPAPSNVASSSSSSPSSASSGPVSSTKGTRPLSGARPATGPRPPVVELPDLGAQLDYLERWCTARVPCAADLVGERRRLAVLDAAALRGLRDEAGRCVARCRR